MCALYATQPLFILGVHIIRTMYEFLFSVEFTQVITSGVMFLAPQKYVTPNLITWGNQVIQVVSPLVPMIPMIDEERKKEKGMARVA